EVGIDREATVSGSITDGYLRLLKAGIPIGDDKATATPWSVGDTDTYTVYGSSTEQWGASWLYSDINDNGFGLEFYASYIGSSDVDALIDHINITIYYLTSPSLQQIHGVMRPDGDIISQWNGTSLPHNTFLSENVDEPAEPELSSYIFTSSRASGTNQIDEFSMDYLDINSGTVTEISIKIYGSEAPSIDSTVNIYIAGAWETAQQLDMTTADWYTYTWTGLSYTQGQLDNMRVKFDSVIPNKGPVESYEQFDYVQFGDILDNSLGGRYTFTITTWVNPSLFASNLSSNGIKNVFLSKDGSLELGISENGHLQVFMDNGISTSAEYGIDNIIPLDTWTFVAFRYMNGDTDVMIGDIWYNLAIGDLEPWIGGGLLANGGDFVIGAELTDYSCFNGVIDTVSVFNRSITDLEVATVRDGVAASLSTAALKEKVTEGWTPIIIPGEIIDGHINLEVNVTSGAVDFVEFYLTNYIPNSFIDPVPNNWSLMANRSESPYSVVIDTHSLPDEDNWYFIVRAVDSSTLDPIYKMYLVPFGIKYFNDTVDFYYDDSNGRINQNSHIGVVPLDGFEAYINTTNVYINYSNSWDLLNPIPINYSDISSNYDLIDLDTLTSWIQTKGLTPENYFVNFNITFFLNYGPEFGSYNYTYRLSRTILDIKGPDISLNVNPLEYSLELGKSYSNTSENILTAAIDFTDTDFESVRIDYSYTVGGNWILYDSFPNTSNTQTNISINILNFRDDKISFRFIAVDDLGNNIILTDSSYFFVKDFDNHQDFLVQYLGENSLYNFDSSNMVDITAKIIPFDNDITSVALTTDHELFNLTIRFEESTNIYYSDEISEDIKLDGNLYGIIPGEFKLIPLTIWLYQGKNSTTSKIVNILVTDTIFGDSVNITNVEFDYDIQPQTDNVWMTFETSINTLKNSHEIPYIINNKYPKIVILDSTNKTVDSFLLKANSDDIGTENYLSIDITDSIFYLPLPSLQVGEELSHLYEILIDSKSYTNFSYFIDSQNIFIRLNGTDFSIPKDVTLNYEISNIVHPTRQFIGTYDFQALPQGNYSLIGRFFDISGNISTYILTTPFTLDFEGPNIYNQFNDEFSVNPEGGNISFIIKDVSNIISYQFDVPLAGNWVIENSTYTFVFNDNTLVEGLANYQLITEDSLNFISTKDFSLTLDKSDPVIVSTIYSDPEPWNGIYLVRFNIDDISPYQVKLRSENTISGIIYNELDISYITTVISATETEWQILFDTNQLPNGRYDIYVVVTDEAGNSIETSFLDKYFDNSPPDITSSEMNIYVSEFTLPVYTIELIDTLYFSNQQYFTISTSDILYDGFSWLNVLNYEYLDERLGVEAVTMFHTKPLAYHAITLSSPLDFASLTYEIIDYDSGNTVLDNIKSIQKIRIGSGSDWEEIDKFTTYKVGTSLFIEIVEEFRFLLSSSSQVEAQFYEAGPTGISLGFDASSVQWNLNAFDISASIAILQGDEFLFWIEAHDLIGNIDGSTSNRFISRKYKGIYDNQMSGTPQFQWSLGETGSSEGILLFGTENPEDSTIDIDISSVSLDPFDNSDVERIYIYGSSDDTLYSPLGNDQGRAFYSSSNIWSFTWDNDLSGETPENYYIKAYIFDKAGKYLTTLQNPKQVKLYDYDLVELISDLAFGDIIDYDPTLSSNVFDITGEFYLQDLATADINLWDIIAKYYDPLATDWIPLYTQPAVLQEAGAYADYTITWDINQDKDFMDLMYGLTYEFLPLKVVDIDESSNIWGSWGVFDISGEWKPIIMLDSASQLDIVVYEFDSINGWIVDTALSAENPIGMISNQVFKIFDVNGDGIDEIVRVSSNQIDVIYFDQSNWVIKEDCINDPNLQFSLFDLNYDIISQETTIVLFQDNSSSGNLEIGKYYFDFSYNLIPSQRRKTFLSTVVPTSLKIIEKFSLNQNTAVLIGATDLASFNSQLYHYDYNLNLIDTLDNSILGTINVIEFDRINGIETIVLGVSRVNIGKLDVVTYLKYNDQTDSWTEYEIIDFDEIRLQIFDLMFINDNNLKNLVISTDSGVFKTTIEYTQEEVTITDPIKFTTAQYTYSQLNDYKMTGIERFIITDAPDTPIYQINEIYYEDTNIWYKLSDNLYYITFSQDTFDLQLDSSIWSILGAGDNLKIAYSYLSYLDERRQSIDTSFDVYGNTPESTIYEISAFSRFFDDSALPFLLLNPTSTVIDPFADWRIIDNSDVNYRGINYQYLPVSSGLGTSVRYPTKTIGFGNGITWGTEYINMPELENSLIYYDNSYDSGILSQYLTGKDDLLGEDQFDGEFSGNYLNSVYISNPAISESYDFSELYYDNIHDPNDPTNIYEVNGDKIIPVRNRLSRYNFDSFDDPEDNGLFYSGTLPDSGTLPYKTFADATLKDVENSLTDWNEYVSLKMASTSTKIFQFEVTYKLPVVDRAGLQSIQVSFDASIVSTSIVNEYPLSLQIYNYVTPGWESIPLAPLVGETYNQNYLDYDFWTWPSTTPANDRFRPSWGTTNTGNMNTLSYGINYPYSVDSGNLEFDTAQFDPAQGVNFLDIYRNQPHEINTYWSFTDLDGFDHHKIMAYDGSYNTNKFQFEPITIDPNNFYTTSTTFPVPDSIALQFPTTPYTADQFYNYFFDDNHEFTLRLITEKEAANTAEAYLTIGDLKTYTITDSNYLNYDDFDSNIITSQPMQHVSDRIDFVSDGIILQGYSGFDIKDDSGSAKLPSFSENFNGGNLWSLAPGPQPSIIVDMPLLEDTYLASGGIISTLALGNTWFLSLSDFLDYIILFQFGEIPYLQEEFSDTSSLFLDAWEIAVDELTYNVYTTNTDWEEGALTGVQYINGLIDPVDYVGQQNIQTMIEGLQEYELGVFPNKYDKTSIMLKSITPGIDNTVTAFSKEGAGISPFVRSHIAKAYQGNGLVYIQSDTSEMLTLQSSLYSPTSLNIDDTVEFTLQVDTIGEVYAFFYNGPSPIPVESMLIHNAGSSTPYKHIITKTVGSDFTFDRIELVTYLFPGDFLKVFDIFAFSENNIGQVYKLGDSYDFVEQSTPQYPTINYGTTTLGSPNNAHSTDSNYWQISSENNKVEIDFLFENLGDISNLRKLDIVLDATGNNIVLDGNIDFSYFNYQTNDFQQLPTIDVNGANFVVSLPNTQLNSLFDFQQNEYILLLKIMVTSTSSFDFKIDNLVAKAFDEWSLQHDLYKASFTFIPQNYGGEIRLYIKEGVKFDLSTYTLGEHTVSFYYETSTQKWYIYIDQTLAQEVFDPNPIGFMPRIETHFTSNNEGIKVTEISTIYYKKIETQSDFLDYKNLVSSYNEGLFTDGLFLDNIDAFLTPENTFTQISSDIEILYDFKDGIVADNIFSPNSPNLIYSKNYDSSDDIQTYIYQEQSVEIEPNDNSLTKTEFLGTMGSENVYIPNPAVNVFGDLVNDNGIYHVIERFDTVNNELTEVISNPEPENWDIPRGFPQIAQIIDNPQGEPLTITNGGNYWYNNGETIPNTFASSPTLGWSQYEDSARSQYLTYGQVVPFLGWTAVQTIEEFEFDVSPLSDWHIEFKIRMEAGGNRGDNNNWGRIEIMMNYGLWNDVTPLINLIRENGQYNWYNYATDILAFDTFDYIQNYDGGTGLGQLKLRIRVYASHDWWTERPWIRVETDVARVVAEGYVPPSSINFRPQVGDIGKDFYLFYEGRLSRIFNHGTDFLIKGLPAFPITSTEAQHDEILVMNIQNGDFQIPLALNGDYWIYDRGVKLDYLYLVDINRLTTVPIKNPNTISVADTMSKSQNSEQGLWLEDPHLRGVMQYTLENSISTPIFRIGSEQVTTQFKLEDVKLDFEVFDLTHAGPISSTWDNSFIEGKDYDDNLYPDYLSLDTIDYITSRLKNTAIDDLSIPLMTPIELDFGSFYPNLYSNIELEILLDFDINLANRLDPDKEWSLRNRLLYYDFQNNKWEDYQSTFRVQNKILATGFKDVWDYGSEPNHLEYLVFPSSHEFVNIQDSNDLEVQSSLLIQNLDSDFFNNNNGIMKLALLSYILPGNWEDPANRAVNGDIFFERADSTIPIQISQSLNIQECVLLLEERNILYTESSISTTLDLDPDFKTFLGGLNPQMGEIISVKGIKELETSTEEYPIFDYQVINNYLEVYSHNDFISKVSIEYIPQMNLELISTKWYLPDILTQGNDEYENPYFISEVLDDKNYYGTKTSPTSPVQYSLELDIPTNRLYVDFDTPPNAGDTPRGAVHFAKLNGKYSNRFALKDYLLYNFDVLDSYNDLTGGKLHLSIESGFNDILLGTETTQLATDYYRLRIELYTIANGIDTYIGYVEKQIDNSNLAYVQTDFEISLQEILFEPGGFELLSKALTTGYYSDFYITVETSIANTEVNTHLFTGHYAQQITDVSFELIASNSESIYNSIPVDTPYLELYQADTQLLKVDDLNFKFDPSTLKYGFAFDISELRTDSNTIITDFIFNPSDYSVLLQAEYSGLLYADIVYHAFEWQLDYISTLSPLTLSFSGDFISRYTKYLEFEIQFNTGGIPGYELESVDAASGKILMTQEKKNANLLKVYMLNERTGRYDFIDTVVYDNFGDSDTFLPTFSYIVDRNFIVFEDYFKDTGTGFDITFLLVIDENFNNFFRTDLSFDINSINAKVYYDPKHTEYFINPSVIFDIDLTDFFKGSDIYLDDVTLSFNYLTELLFDNAQIVSSYALIEESFSFMIRNKFLEFELFALEGSKLHLSKEILEDLLIHDTDNDKYYLRFKLEYDWSCILEINIGSISHIEIISAIQLLQYSVNVKFTEFKTSRISAFESSSSHDLASILAPNYVETASGIVVFPDDNEVDIGLNAGFLKNKDTKQRLMIKQELYYDFPDSLLSPISILVDQSYTDAILRFAKPTGYLESPNDIFLNNSQIFTFVSDFEVSSITLNYMDINSVEQNVGDMLPDASNPEMFTYLWNGISSLGFNSGDTIEVIIRLTDVYSNINEYHYFYEADFINPVPTITIGAGGDFENNFANPLTDISFDSDIPTSSELWNEPLSTYDPTQMSYNDYPDYYSKIWEMDPFHIKNLFPTISSFDDWSGWGAVNYQPIPTHFLRMVVVSVLSLLS
ncbi:hypothetical protein LCGC14_0601690, partial [marine sediment metagenome]